MMYSHGYVVTITGHSSFSALQPMQVTDPCYQFWNTWKCKSWIKGSAQTLWDAIIQSLAVAVSDGSYQDAVGMAVWTIEGKQQHTNYGE